MVLLLAHAIFTETSRTKRCESDNIARSTFGLIGRRALQMCICHKHYKIHTHNANAFHIWIFRWWLFCSSILYWLVSMNRNTYTICSSIDCIPFDSIRFCAMYITHTHYVCHSFDVWAKSAVFPNDCPIYSCESISWWSGIDGSRTTGHSTPHTDVSLPLCADHSMLCYIVTIKKAQLSK